MGFPLQESASQSVSLSLGKNVSRIASASAPQPHCMNFNVRFQRRVRIRFNIGKRKCTRSSFQNPLRFNRKLRFHNFHPLENPLSLSIRIRFGNIQEKNISRSGSTIAFDPTPWSGPQNPLLKRTFASDDGYRSTPHCVSITIENPVNNSLQVQTSHGSST